MYFILGFLFNLAFCDPSIGIPRDRLSTPDSLSDTQVFRATKGGAITFYREPIESDPLNPQPKWTELSDFETRMICVDETASTIESCQLFSLVTFGLDYRMPQSKTVKRVHPRYYTVSVYDSFSKDDLLTSKSIHSALLDHGQGKGLGHVRQGLFIMGITALVPVWWATKKTKSGNQRPAMLLLFFISIPAAILESPAIPFYYWPAEMIAKIKLNRYINSVADNNPDVRIRFRKRNTRAFLPETPLVD